MRYHQIFVPFVLIAIPLVVLATPQSPHWDDMRTKHSWSAVPEDWECSGLPPIGTTINLYVALRPHREDALTQALYEVSTPGHPKYRAHLSREQVAEISAPHPDTLQLVHSWLEYRGVPSSSISVSHGGDSLRLSGVPVPRANDLLGASYRLCRHVKTNETIVRTLGYALPTLLDGHVQVVVPTTSFDFPQNQLQETHEHFSGEKREDVPLTRPAILSWLYSTWAYSLGAKDKNSLGIVTIRQVPSETDLKRFMKLYRYTWKDWSFTVDEFKGAEGRAAGRPMPRPGYVANMQMQYSQAMASPTRHISYVIDEGELLPWLQYMVNEEIIPKTILIPQGGSEKFYSIDHAKSVCNEIKKLGARGVSVLVASGDSGVGGGPGDCRDPSGKVRFLPSFPATCPEVTAVGGTTNFVPEVAARLSGGGFSDYFGRPNYQHVAVSSFLQVETLTNELSGKYNESGRGIPDISAQALNFIILSKRATVPASGTTISAAIVAGIISLLNDNQLSGGNPPLGFLNPLLYRLHDNGLKGLNDVKSGSNPGCGTKGFFAAEGWDPATGLGTLDFEQLQKIFDLAQL